MGRKKKGTARDTDQRILDAIIGYIRLHQYPPTIREIRDIVGLSSTSSVYSHIQKMLEDGRLESDAKPGTPRAIRVPGYCFQEKTKEIPEKGGFLW